MLKTIATYLATLLVITTLAGCQPQQPAVVPATRCLGCCSGPDTYCAQIADWDVAVVARLTQLSPLNGIREPQGTFEFVEVLKGQSFVPASNQLTIGIDGTAAVGDVFVLVSDAREGLKWTRLEQPITSAAQDYLVTLFHLPNVAERQKFHLQHLLAADEDVADDSIAELQDLKLSELQHLRPHLQYDEIVAQIQNPDIRASHRRFYFNLLGICGSEQDLPLLETILQSSIRQERVGLDAAIACYLTLKGIDGLPLIERRFLQDKQASYLDTYCAIMAVRVHLYEAKVIDQTRLIESLRIMLQRPELADLVIPDLAKQHDWTVMEQLFEMYKTADTEHTWLRVPVINYLRQCPLPRAKELLVECQQIDPDAVQRAKTFHP
jgi:hypothetical protein